MPRRAWISPKGDRTKQRIKYLAQKTFNKQVLGEIGGFGGLFRLDTAKYANPSWFPAPTASAPS